MMPHNFGIFGAVDLIRLWRGCRTRSGTGSRLFVSPQDTLVEQLELCVDYLWKSERHELIADINKPVIAVFEKRRDFKVTPSPSPTGNIFGLSASSSE